MILTAEVWSAAKQVPVDPNSISHTGSETALTQINEQAGKQLSLASRQNWAVVP
jgi:hypothetical protein